MSDVAPSTPAPASAAHRDQSPGAELAGAGVLRDTWGRTARDLRVSLTDRCNLRCTYCMPAEGLTWTPTEEVLTTEEFLRLITLAVTRLGIRQVRFTGGEPLLNRDLEVMVAHVKSLRTDQDRAPGVAITTNGLGLKYRAQRLADAGLDRVNLSLDTLSAERYGRMTRRNMFPQVLAGLDATLAAGLHPVKINSVVMPGENEEDVIPLAIFALDKGCQLRFIEQMPLGPGGTWTREGMIPAEHIIAQLSQRFEMEPASEPRGSAPARLWRVVDKKNPERSGHIGIIASVTQSFCGDCDRTRLTSDGCIRSCLFSREETSLRDLMRDGADDDALADAWIRTMFFKPAGHGIDDPMFVQPDRLMSEIGG